VKFLPVNCKFICDSIPNQTNKTQTWHPYV